MRKAVLHVLYVCSVYSVYLGALSASAQATVPAAKKARVSPIIMKLRISYKAIYEGIEDDIRRNNRQLARYKSKLKKAKEKTRDKYNGIIQTYEELIASEWVIAGMFDGTSRRMSIENAMRKIPELESRLRLATGKKSERGWLTFEEVRKRLKAGMRYRKCPQGVLPYSKDIWYKPKERKKNR